MSAFLGSTSVAASIALLLIGAAVTLGISMLAISLGFLIAFPVCMAELSQRRVLRGLGRLYVSFFRGVPLLVQLLVIYYLLPFIGIELPSFLAAAIGLAVCTAAYQAENLRGGFLIVPAGQAAAAQAFGYTRWKIWRHILLPQALRAAMPAVINEMIAILKASSLVSVVGAADLMRISQNIVARSQQPIAWYSLAALIYLGLNLVLAALGRRSEMRLGRGSARASL
jgi:polar amino acid transport system permease protein